MIFLLVGIVVLGGCAVGGFLIVNEDDDPPRRPASQSGPLFSTSAPGSPSAPKKVTIDASFLASTVTASNGTYRRSSRWTQRCTSGLKARLERLVREKGCRGSLYGAMYQGPNKKTFVQMTVIRMNDSADARSVSRRVNASTAPVIRVANGLEPGHWWSSASSGEYMLIRQSFNSGSRYPGPRNGPAQVYGDVLIRKLQTELSTMRLWAN